VKAPAGDPAPPHPSWWGSRRGWDLLLPALAVVAPTLPAISAVLTLVTTGLLWLLLRLPRRERIVLSLCLLVAAALLAVGAWQGRAEAVDRPQWIRLGEGRYAALWEDIRGLAGKARDIVRETGTGPEERLAAFGDFAALVPGQEKGWISVLLVDPDGEAQAWAGTGLLYEPRPSEIPREGLHAHAGLSAITLIAIEPLDEARRPWRIVAGRSLPTDVLPFLPPGGEEPGSFRWSILGGGLAGPPPAAAIVLAPEGYAPMLVQPSSPRSSPSSAPTSSASAGVTATWGRWAWGALALGFLALAMMRGAGLALGGAGADRAPGLIALVVAGLFAAGLAAGVALPALAVTFAGFGLLTWGLIRGPRRLGGGLAAAFGAGAAVAALAAAWFYQRSLGPWDLSGDLFGSTGALLLRLGLTGIACSLLAVTARSSPPRQEGKGPPSGRGRRHPAENGGGAATLLAAGALLLVAAAGVDHPLLAVPCLILAAAGMGPCLARSRLPFAAGGLALLIVLSAVISGIGWEVVYREVLRRDLATTFLPAMAPPEPAELAAFAAGIDDFFADLDVTALALRPLADLERGDLAFSLWRHSPLARHNALSALVIEPTGEYTSLAFSYGLPLEEGAPVARDSAAWQELALPVWDELEITGETALRDGDRVWGTVRWWFFPRPAFRLGEPHAVEQVLLDLIKGTPGEPRAPKGLPPPTLYALYPANGRALISPWQELPPVPPELARTLSSRTSQPAAGSGVGEPGEPPGAESAAARVATPSGLAWAYARSGSDGYEVLYLPVLSPFEALERVGTFTAAVLLVLAGLGVIALLLALPRPAFRDLLARTVRSYSRRLILIYTLLLLVPLLLLNFVILRTVEVRLSREQQTRGEQALMAAQRSVLSSILSQEPGFGIDTTLSPDYLKGLARLVNHDVNAYFGSQELHSSTEELFAAGFLPRRIPGEIYARLALVGFGIDDRTNRVLDTPYLELYAPVSLPGESDPRIFLSLPLLAQQEETASVLAALRRRAVVASTALIALLVAVGARLARNFTRPLAELVEGTRRIAAGAPSLDLAPTELELAALVEAVDDMARRIDQGRQALLREKALVERMVEHITSGVVSLDRHLAVLMHNRVAAELLGIEVGQRLVSALTGDERLLPVAEFLRRAAGGEDEAEGGRPLQETVRLGQGEDGEREWTLVWVPLPAPGEPTALLVVEDVTEVFRGQRLTAWAEMARMIAHEIKNPLTPVRLSAEHMRQVWATDREHFEGIFERCTANILKQVDELQEIASEFSTYSRIPKMELVPAELEPVLAALAEAYQGAAAVRGVRVTFTPSEERVRVRFDERLLGRAVRNLLENAVRASPEGGVVELALGREGSVAAMTVADEGPGVRPELLSRIFDPYFSTHDTGTGLGLPIARRIAEEHGGEIIARNRPEGGLAVEIRIPLV